MRKFINITRPLAFVLIACLVIIINVDKQKMAVNSTEYRDGSLLSSISVPHGPHYSYLQNDNQRFLYDLIYKIMAPSIMHKDDELIFYSIGEVPSRGYYSYLNNGYDIVFAHEAVKYDNPNRVEFSLCPWEFSYKKNASNTFNAYISAGQGDIGSYNSMNAQLDAAADSLINSAQSLGLIDLSSDESKKMSLFKLALYMAPCQPLNNNYFKNADDYDWWGIVYNWDAKKDTLNEYPHTAYAALCDKYAVCDGVSMAYMYVLKKLGINECVCIDGFYGTDHAWNLIKLNNYWYDIDVTNMTINGIEFANGEINKRRLDRLFGIAMPASSGSRNIGTELGEKYIAERAEKYGFRQGSPSQESNNSESSENPSNNSSESTTAEIPSNSGSEGSSSSESPSSLSNTGSTANPDENGSNASSNSSNTASTETTNNNGNSGNSNTVQPSNPSSSDNGNSNSNAGTSTSTPASTPSSNENDNVSSNAANNASNNATTQTSSNEEVKPSSSGTTQQTDTKKDDKTKETTTKKDTKTAKIIPATPKNVSTKVSKKTVTVKWKKQTKNTTGYEIQYSTDKKFKKSVKTVSAKKTATKTTIKKLKAKKTYYVRIRTKCKNGSKTTYSKWSKVMKVKIK